MLLTPPLPAPPVATFSDHCFLSKAAVTFLAPFIVTTQVVAEPEHMPLQPANVESDAGAAVSVTGSPEAKVAAQLPPQSMPAGELVTPPEPPPVRVTVRLSVPAAVVAVD